CLETTTGSPVPDDARAQRGRRRREKRSSSEKIESTFRKLPETELYSASHSVFSRGCPDGVEARGACAADACAAEFVADFVLLTSTVWWHRSDSVSVSDSDSDS